MKPMEPFDQGLTIEARLTAADAPARHTTTLYDVIAALSSLVAPDEDDLVVAVVVRWLRTGRIALVGDVTLAA